MENIENNKKVITELDIDELKLLQTKMHKQLLIIKFGAEWCGPCKKIAPSYKEFMMKCPENIICADINVDNNLDLYMGLKKAKMVQSIPVFLAFWGGIKRDVWYIPDDSVIGSDEKLVGDFFNRCIYKANEMNSTQEGYSYFS